MGIDRHGMQPLELSCRAAGVAEAAEFLAVLVPDDMNFIVGAIGDKQILLF